MKKILLYFFVLTLYFSSKSQITKADHYNTIDNKIFVLNKVNPSFDSIVSFVNQNFTSQEDKIRAYYSWIATNVVYDIDHLNDLITLTKMKAKTSSAISQNPDTVFRKRKAVCEGYSLLLNKFCAASSIPSFIVGGYSKLPDGEVYTEILHAWNAVRADSTWYLIDVTWSGGYVNSMNQYVQRFSDKYFFSSPKEFVKDHLPLDPMWQLNNEPLTKNNFFNIKDTLSVKNTPYSFLDSLNIYLKAETVRQNQIDFIHYHLYDPLNVEFMLELDRVVNNTAADYLLNASVHYQNYVNFQTKKMGKHPTAASCKKGKALLEIPKKDLLEAISYLKNQKAYTNEYAIIFKEMVNTATANLKSIKENVDSINAYMKSIGAK